MERLLSLLLIFASSSIISAGNDTTLASTTPPNTTASTVSVDSRTADPTEKPVSSTFSSQHENVTTSLISKAVSTTTAPLSSRHTVSTDGSSTSGQSIFTSFTLTSPKSYTDTTLNAISSSVAETTVTVGVSVLPKTSTTVNSNISMSEFTATPSQSPDNSLTLLAFGVMSLILILIVVMVILVTTVNFRGRCRDTRQHKDVKSYVSMASDRKSHTCSGAAAEQIYSPETKRISINISITTPNTLRAVMTELNMTSNCEKENITLVSVRTINTENDTDSPQISSVHSTIVDNEDQELSRDLMGLKDGV